MKTFAKAYFYVSMFVLICGVMSADFNVIVVTALNMVVALYVAVRYIEDFYTDHENE